MKILSIKKSAEFKAINNNGLKFFSHTAILLAKPTPEFYFFDSKTGKNARDFCRIGFTASKKVGNAVVRNRAKRRLREIFAELAPIHARNHYDYVLIAKKQITKEDFVKIFSDVKFCLKRIHR